MGAGDDERISRCLKWELTRELPKMKKLSWEEHIKLGHLPYRRDCRVCQEASARDRPHRRLRHPEGNVLSVDLTGPFRYGRDTDDVEDKRYLLVATYTWPQVNVEEAEVLPEGHREGDDSGHLPEPAEEIPEEEEAEESLEAEEGASPEAEEPIIPEREEPGPLKTLYFTVPLRSKEKKEVLGGIQESYIRLRREGMLVNRLHSRKRFGPRTRSRRTGGPKQRWECSSRS